MCDGGGGGGVTKGYTVDRESSRVWELSKIFDRLPIIFTCRRGCQLCLLDLDTHARVRCWRLFICLKPSCLQEHLHVCACFGELEKDGCLWKLEVGSLQTSSLT